MLVYLYMAANTGITHMRAHMGRTFCGNRRAQQAVSADEFRALLLAPVSPVPTSGGMLGERVCKRCADKLADCDARKAARATSTEK